MLPSLLEEAEKLAEALGNWRQTVLGSSATTPGERALLGLLADIGPASVPEIARARGVSRQRAQQQIDALAGSGWVERAPNPAHKRSPLFSLADPGRALLDSLRADERAALDRLRAGTSDEAVRTAAQVLSAWREALVDDARAHDTDRGSS